MKVETFKKLAEIMMLVVVDRKIKNLLPTDDPNKLEGVYFNQKNEELPLFVEHCPDKNSIRVYTNMPHFSGWTLGVESVNTLQKYKAEGTTYADLNKPIMTRRILAERINDMKFELRGHYSGHMGNNDSMIQYFREKFLDEFNRNLNGANGENDGKWNERDGKTMEEVNESMRQFYLFKVDYELGMTDRIFDSTDDRKCSCCGKSLELVLKDENTITVYPGYAMRESGDLDLDCAYPNGPGHSGGTININSDFIFANFFRDTEDEHEDAPEGERYGDKYDLCSFSGRRNITKWKAENQNIAYGQMGNMSMSVWINSTRDRIILTEAYMESEAKEQKLRDMGFKKVGKNNISLSMWRWEATDVNTLEKHRGKPIKDIFKDMNDDYEDYVRIKVKPGTWEFTHYYDTTPDPENEDELFIYAELKLKE